MLVGDFILGNFLGGPGDLVRQARRGPATAFDLHALPGDRPRPEASREAGLLYPVMQRLRRTADLGRYRDHCRPPPWVLAGVIQNHPNPEVVDLAFLGPLARGLSQADAGSSTVFRNEYDPGHFERDLHFPYGFRRDRTTLPLEIYHR